MFQRAWSGDKSQIRLSALCEMANVLQVKWGYGVSSQGQRQTLSYVTSKLSQQSPKALDAEQNFLVSVITVSDS